MRQEIDKATKAENDSNRAAIQAIQYTAIAAFIGTPMLEAQLHSGTGGIGARTADLWHLPHGS